VLSIEEFNPICSTNGVAKLLEQTQFVERDDDSQNSTSETEDDSVDEEAPIMDIGNTIAGLQTNVRCLIDLSGSLFAPVLDSGCGDDAATGSASAILEMHQPYSNCIRESFPEAPQDLVDHLGRANLRRYQALSDARLKPHIGDQLAISAERSAKASNDDSGYRSLIMLPPRAATVASSRVSSLGSGNHSKYPPLPEIASSGQSFDCCACGRNVVVLGIHQWRQVAAKITGRSILTNSENI
jgi:hypothetical protein